jgi:anaerobic magnesium-protoporphyrin IX monomethyl ester cyclase
MTSVPAKAGCASLPQEIKSLPHLMLGHRTLLINPPLINGIAFTRQGRCQEREDVLGTTKPPYSLAVMAALLRDHGVLVRLIDQTAERLSTAAVIDRLKAEGFAPTLVVFCSTTPTFDADMLHMVRIKEAFSAALVCFGPHASCAPHESMERAPGLDAMLVGEPEDALLDLARLPSLDRAGEVPSVIFRRHGEIVSQSTHGTCASFTSLPYPAWDLLSLDRYRLPLANKPYALIETSRGCPYSCDFCVAPIHQGHKFRERDAKSLVDEIERGKREHGLEYFYLWGDTVTLNVKSFSLFCEELIARNLDIKWFGNARADNLVDPEFVRRLRKSGCWMLSLGIESDSDELRRDMLKRLDREKIQRALDNLRQAGIKSFAFFILGYPGETPATMERTAEYAVELDPDFANFYPAVPYPGTELYEKCRRGGLLTTDDWSKLEYSYYVLRGGGLDEPTVMAAINRARRRFFLRPRYVRRHFSDLVRLAVTDKTVIVGVLSRMLFGRPVIDATEAPPLPSTGHS